MIVPHEAQQNDTTTPGSRVAQRLEEVAVSVYMCMCSGGGGDR